MRTILTNFKSKLLFVACLFLFITGIEAQNVGINSTGATPNSAAILDLNTGNSGTQAFLPQKVALTSTTIFAPVAPASSSVTAGFLVYNTNTNGAGTSTAVYANTIYYWDGLKWVAIYGNGGAVGSSYFNNIGLNTTSASTTYVIPAGVTQVKVFLVGGGGGAGSTSGADYQGGNGGMVCGIIDVIPGETLNIVCGAGGTGSSSSAGNGGKGSSITRASTSTLLCGAGGGSGAGKNTYGDCGGTAYGTSLNGANGNTSGTTVATPGNNYIAYIRGEAIGYYCLDAAVTTTPYVIGSPAGTAGYGRGTSQNSGANGVAGFVLIFY